MGGIKSSTDQRRPSKQWQLLIHLLSCHLFSCMLPSHGLCLHNGHIMCHLAVHIGFAGDPSCHIASICIHVHCALSSLLPMPDHHNSLPSPSAMPLHSASV